MSRKPKALKKSRLQTRLQIIASLFVILAVPAVVLGIMDIQTYDTRSRAGTEQESLLKCRVKFLYVDPNSLQKDKTVTMDISASVPESTITGVSLVSTIENEPDIEIYSNTYTDGRSEISEIFTYTPDALGQYSISGVLNTTDSAGVNRVYPCLLETEIAYGAEIIEQNNHPEFISAIPEKSTNIIKVGDTYTHKIEAIDTDNYASFNYAYSFSPSGNWLKAEIDKQQEGNGGKITVDLSGVADYPASYLINMLIWDGYNGHTKAQAWVINVDPAENDIPNVTFSKPAEGTKIRQGDDVEIAWSVEDQNHIVGFKLYISQNPTNQNSWILIDDKIDYDYGAFILNTANFPTGDYVAIIQATDNQNPPLTGTGVSNYFEIGSVTVIPDTPSDDGSQLRDAEVINISPDDGSMIENRRPIIKATVIAEKGAEVIRDSINFELDDVDLTGQLKISKINEGEYSLNYTSTEDLDYGIHKVSVYFEDSKENKITKDWSFTILEPEDETEYVSIFGYKIPVRTAIIGGIVAFGLIVLAIVVPWLLYGLFKKSDEEYNYDIYPTKYDSSSASSTSSTSSSSLSTRTTQPSTKPAGANFSTSYSPYYTSSYDDYKEKAVPTEVPTTVTTEMSTESPVETETVTETVTTKTDSEVVSDAPPATIEPENLQPTTTPVTTSVEEATIVDDAKPTEESRPTESEPIIETQIETPKDETIATTPEQLEELAQKDYYKGFSDKLDAEETSEDASISGQTTTTQQTTATSDNLYSYPGYSNASTEPSTTNADDRYDAPSSTSNFDNTTEIRDNIGRDSTENSDNKESTDDPSAQLIELSKQLQEEFGGKPVDENNGGAVQNQVIQDQATQSQTTITSVQPQQADKPPSEEGNTAPPPTIVRE